MCVSAASVKKKKKSKKVSEEEVGVSEELVTVWCVFDPSLTPRVSSGHPAERRLLHPSRVKGRRPRHVPVAPPPQGQSLSGLWVPAALGHVT